MYDITAGIVVYNTKKEELKKVTDKKAVLIKGSRGMKLEEIID